MSAGAKTRNKRPAASVLSPTETEDMLTTVVTLAGADACAGNPAIDAAAPPLDAANRASQTHHTALRSQVLPSMGGG
jgi:hypothetical protein